MNIESIVRGSHITKQFKGFKVDIDSLNIPKGFATALIGENGAGKSTLMNILAGVRLDYKGDIIYFDGNMKPEEIRENIAYTSPVNYFMPNWTIEQVGDAGRLLFEHFDYDRYRQLLIDMDVKAPEGKRSKDKAIGKLSDGMKMKVELSAAFARETKLLLLDEPASPLDPLMRDKLCSMISAYIDEGSGEKSVFFSTHNIADMENITDYAMIMEQGKIVEQGFVEDLKEKYIMVKGNRADAEQAKEILYTIQTNPYGFEGICLDENLDKLSGMDISTEIPTLSQISVAVMKHYTKLAA